MWRDSDLYLDKRIVASDFSFTEKDKLPIVLTNIIRYVTFGSLSSSIQILMCLKSVFIYIYHLFTLTKRALAVFNSPDWRHLTKMPGVGYFNQRIYFICIIYLFSVAVRLYNQHWSPHIF